MGSSASVKVGCFVVAAFTLFMIVAFFFANFGRMFGSYPVNVRFEDAQGVQPGAAVRLAGVTVGAVREVTLAPDGRSAVVKLGIDKTRLIPRDSEFTITTGGFIGELFVRIDPPENSRKGMIRTDGREPVLEGQNVPSFDALKKQAASLGARSNAVMANLQRASEQVADLTSDDDLGRAIKLTSENIANASDEANQAARALNEFVRLHSPLVASSLKHVDSASRNLDDGLQQIKPLAQEAKGLVSDLRQTISFLQGTLEDLDVGPLARESLDNVRKASARLDAIAANAERISSDLAKVTGDPKLNEDIRTTVTQVRKTAENAGDISERLKQIAEKDIRKPKLTVRGKFSLDALQRTSGETRFRSDLNYVVPTKDGSIVAGIYDFGDSNKLNLQAGTNLSPNLIGRYGFHASRLSLGLDYRPGKRHYIGLEFFDPNDANLDLYYRTRIDKNMGLVLGAEDILHHGRATIGLSYTP